MPRLGPFAFLLVIGLLAVALTACGGGGNGSATGDEEGVTDTGGADTVTPEEGAGGDRNVTATLDELNGSGQSGTATLSALGEDRTRVVIQVNPPRRSRNPRTSTGVRATRSIQRRRSRSRASRTAARTAR